ncbi:hypothetical protein L207DRAFT_175151 [Hyaloscypha variabilis F]|uniref:Uncharacterized protein n=1 Tax=Hyaloscypha variabilis (strain UAMH 11265 / GT02V1 / F) TaxID=1149755 RepID=A0A2J6R3K9_HYAVF|nr:hypothetical protein L207DRAFT_175151 [Hyaloscypha variabilis F]
MIGTISQSILNKHLIYAHYSYICPTFAMLPVHPSMLYQRQTPDTRLQNKENSLLQTNHPCRLMLHVPFTRWLRNPRSCCEH